MKRVFKPMKRDLFNLLYAKVAECEEKTHSPLIIFGVWMNTSGKQIDYERDERSPHDEETSGFLYDDSDLINAFLLPELTQLKRILKDLNFDEEPDGDSPAFSCKDLFEAAGIIR